MINRITITIVLLIASLHSQSCIAQQSQTALPKIEDYTKGELEIKVVPFGLDNPISVGKIAADGTIHFNWNSDLSTIKNPLLYMSSIKNTIGMTFCNTKEIEQNNEAAKSVHVDELFLYKNEIQVGALVAATQKAIEDNSWLNRLTSLDLGSTISWIYSDIDAQFKARCTVNKNWESSYNFNETTTYNLNLKKGWNSIENTLVEKEDWESETQKGSLPKTMTKTSLAKIPNAINWYVKYWAE